MNTLHGDVKSIRVFSKISFPNGFFIKPEDLADEFAEAKRSHTLKDSKIVIGGYALSAEADESVGLYLKAGTTAATNVAAIPHDDELELYVEYADGTKIGFQNGQICDQMMIGEDAQFFIAFHNKAARGIGKEAVTEIEEPIIVVPVGTTIH